MEISKFITEMQKHTYLYSPVAGGGGQFDTSLNFQV